jgi:hypothetical protein
MIDSPIDFVAAILVTFYIIPASVFFVLGIIAIIGDFVIDSLRSFK